MPSTSIDLIASTKWDGSNETHDGYKTWMNEVSIWANNNDMARIMKIAKRLQEAINFRRPVSRAPPLVEQFLDEAHAARPVTIQSGSVGRIIFWPKVTSSAC